MKFRRLAAVALWVVAASSHSATIFEKSAVLAAPDAPAAAPQSRTFTISTPGEYVFTLSDLQTPVALGSLRAIVSRDLQVVAGAEVANGSSQPATATFTATAGTYAVHVLGAPQQDQTAGTYGVRVAPAAGGNAVLETADTISRAAVGASAQTTLQSDFTIATAGTYELVVTDHVFPSALTFPSVVLLQQTSGGPVPIPQPGPFAATPGTYTLIVTATASGPAQAGLFTATVRDGATSTTAFRRTQAVGKMQPGTAITVPTSAAYTLTLSDLAFPSAMASSGAILVHADAVLTAPSGTATAALSAGAADLFVHGTASAQAGVGAVGVKLSQGGSSIHESTRIFDNSPDPTTPAIYSMSSTNALNAGDYAVTLVDFAFPTAFTSLQAAVTQGSTVLNRMTVPTEATVTLSNAPLKVLIAAVPSTNSIGLFSVRVANAPDSGGAAVLESTQGVGGLFQSIPVTIANGGRYDIALADLQFPASLASTALAVTRGTTLHGRIFGGASLDRQELTPGTYVINFQGVPAAATKYGAYALRVSDTPAAPTLTLTASASTVQSGQQATLQWTATNATQCTASNGWTGNKQPSGTQSVGPLNAETKFDLMCEGPGGSVSASVTVGIVAPRKKSGGGSSDLIVLSLAAALALRRTYVVRRRR